MTPETLRQMFAVILTDDACTTATVFEDRSLWEWLTNSDMPSDGQSSWEVRPPEPLAVLLKAVNDADTIQLTCGSYDNDKAQAIAYGVDAPDQQVLIDVDFQLDDDDDDDFDDDDAWADAARKAVHAWAANNDAEITDEHIYVGLWY